MRSGPLPHPTSTFKSSPVCALGDEFLHDGGIWRYVQFKDAVTYVAGHVCVAADSDGNTVTNDYSAAQDTTYPEPVGIVNGVPTEDYYGFVLIDGLYSAATKTAGEDTIADDTWMIPNTSSDGRLTAYLVDPASAGAPTDGELQALQFHTSNPRIKSTAASNDTDDTIAVRIFR